MAKDLKHQDWSKVAEIELQYKATVKASERPRIHRSGDAYALLLATWNGNLLELQEQFKVILLNRACRVLGIITLATGSKTETLADPGLILAAAIKAAATAIVVAHNHPSGNLQPSNADCKFTEKLKLAAAYHDIRLADHIIVTAEDYYSFADQGVL